VTIRKAKDLDTIYDEVKGYDTVLTPDATLREAITKCVDGAFFGEFATTPELLVRSERGNLDEKRDLFATVVNETEMSWKQATYLLDCAVECWGESGDPHEVLKHPKYDSPEMRQVLGILESSDSTYSAMDDHTAEGSVAVVGEFGLNELEKSVLPDDYKSVSVFKKEAFDLPKFRVYQSSTNIVETVRKNVSKERVEDIGIVAKFGSRYEHPLKSGFRSDGVPFIGQEGVAADEDLRTLLIILRAYSSNSRLRVFDIRPVINRIGADVPREVDEMYLPDVGPEALGELWEVLNEDNLRLTDALDRYEALTGRQLTELRESLRLDEVGLLHQDVDDPTVDDLRYYVDTFQVTARADTEGVLFSRPSVSVADRPIVFYLGMDTSWVQTPPDRPWIDEEAFNERELKRFQLLIQSGEEQYYLVQDTQAGDEVTPCFYFHELLGDGDVDGESLTGFTSLDHERYSSEVGETRDAFRHDPPDVDTNEDRTLSQSRLNKLVLSPRGYFFSRLLDDPDNFYTKRGTVVHDFAELYANRPGFVEKRGLDAFVDTMVKEVKPYVDDLDLPVLRTKLRTAAETVVEYLDEVDIETDGTPEGYEKRDYSNIFLEEHDVSLDGGTTEVSFRNEERGVHGIVDLLVNEKQLLDYKTGSSKSVSKIVDNCKPETYDPEDADFQPALYLAHHRDTVPDTDELSFLLFFLMDRIDERVRAKATGSSAPPPDEDVVEISYRDTTFEEYVPTREAYEALCETKYIDKAFGKLGYEAYEDFFADRGIPDTYDEEEMADELLKPLERYVKREVGDYNYVEKACRGVCKNLVGIRGSMLFREDMEELEGFIDRKIDELNRYKQERFPVGEAEMDELDRSDLILKYE
jgi:hypothetical protein